MRPVEKIKRICKICGKEFFVYAHHVKRRRCDFCSIACYGKAKTKGLVQANKANIMTKPCEYCGKDFTLRKWQSNQGRKYCSQSCSRKARKGKAAPRKHNHLTHLIKNVKPNEKCVICGFDRYVEIAHIYPAMRGGSYESENIIFLCPNHHRLYDTHKFTDAEMNKLDSYAKLIYNFLPKRRGWATLI